MVISRAVPHCPAGAEWKHGDRNKSASEGRETDGPDTLYFGLILLKADRISRFHSSRGQYVCVPFSIRHCAPRRFTVYPWARFHETRNLTWGTTAFLFLFTLFRYLLFFLFFDFLKSARYIETRSFVRNLTINRANDGDIYSRKEAFYIGVFFHYYERILFSFWFFVLLFQLFFFFFFLQPGSCPFRWDILSWVQMAATATEQRGNFGDSKEIAWRICE